MSTIRFGSSTVRRGGRLRTVAFASLFVAITVLFVILYVFCMLLYDRLLLRAVMVYANRIRPKLSFLRR